MSGTDWRAQAACRNVEPELFHPTSNGPGSRRQLNEAIQVCATCPAQRDCLEWAYEVNDQWAVLGGLSPRQRAKTRAAWRAAREGVSA